MLAIEPDVEAFQSSSPSLAFTVATSIVAIVGLC